MPTVEQRTDHSDQHRIPALFGDAEMKSSVGLDWLTPSGKRCPHLVQCFLDTLKP
jgi:hypothetical protein